MTGTEWREYLGTVIETIPEGVIVIAADGRIMYANASAQSILGLACGELLGRQFLDHTWKATTLDDKPIPNTKRPALVAMKTRKPVMDALFKLVRPDGSHVTVSVNAAPILNEAGGVSGAVVTCTDVTRSRQVEEELRDSRLQVLSILESITNAFIALDNTWRFSYVNRRAEKLLGKPKLQLLGRSIWEALPELHGTEAEVELTRAVAEQRPISFEAFYAPLDQWIEYHAYPYPGGLSIYFSNITERKRSEKALRATNQLLRALFEASPLAIIAVDLNGNVTTWNPASERMFGWKEEEVMGRPNPIVPEDQWHVFEANLERIFAGEAIRDMELRRLRKDGSFIDITISTAPLRDESGRVTGIMSVASDITERKRTEEELRLKSLLLDSATDSVFVTALDGRIVFANEAAYRTRGYAEEELIGMPLGELDTPEFAKLIRPRIEDLLHTGHARFESAHRKRDGTAMPVEIEAHVIQYKDETAIASIVRDITERKRVEQLSEALNSINAAINSTLDFNEIMERVVVESAKAIGCETAAIDLREGDEWVVSYLHGMPRELIGKRFTDREAKHSVIAITTRKPFVSNDTSTDTRLDPKVIKVFNIRSMMVVPLIVGRDVLGVLFFSNHSAPVPFGAPEIDFANKLAASMALAVENARLYQRQEREWGLSQALNEINAAINSTLDFNKIMQRVVIDSAKAVNAECVAITMREGEHWPVRYLHDLPEGITGHQLTGWVAQVSALAARTRAPVVIDDAYRDTRISRTLMQRYRIRSVLAVPLRVRDESVGTIIFIHRSRMVRFTDDLVDFAGKLSSALSLALENARLYATERTIADTLQEALLVMPTRIGNIDFGYLYRSATEAARVGGDFYDLFELEHNLLGITIGDVSGKGLEAATMTALVKNTLKAYAYDGGPPASIISRTNRVITKLSAPDIFVTVFFAILNTKTGHLQYCSAGHPPTILRRSTSEALRLDVQSPAVGLFAKLKFLDGEENLHPGDVLVGFTDGIIEARCNGGFFGEDYLVEIVKRMDNQSARQIPSLIFNEVMRCTSGKLSDDIAILSVSLKK